MAAISSFAASAAARIRPFFLPSHSPPDRTSRTAHGLGARVQSARHGPLGTGNRERSHDDDVGVAGSHLRIYPGREIFYFEANGVYVRPQSPNTSEPVYFAGTDPRDPGFPPPEDEGMRRKWATRAFSGRAPTKTSRRPLRGRKSALKRSLKFSSAATRP